MALLAASITLTSPWALAAIAGAILLVAFLVNRFTPARRKLLRRLVFIFGLYLLAFGTAAILAKARVDVWPGRIELVALLAGTFTIISLVAIAVFELALPAVGMRLVSITTDLVVGLSYIVATIAVLRSAGMEPSSVIATSAIVSGILALSLQTTLGNVIGGVALQLDGSIHVGDWIQLDGGRQGKVKEIRWRHTVVETRDWDTIIVPNASLLAGNITILGKREGHDTQHRMWVNFNVDFRFSPSRVVEVVEEALRMAPIPRVSLEPEPDAICVDFAGVNRDSFGHYAARYWLTNLEADEPTSSVVRERIYTALRRAGIPLARPSFTMFNTPEDEETEARRLDRHREKRMAALQAIELFKPLNEEELTSICDHLVYAPFVSGETMTKQGAKAHWLYILLTGKAEVVLDLPGAPSKRVAVIEGPNFFGEMSLMTGEPRSANVVARTDCECYRLNREGFEKIIKHRKEILQQISVVLARRKMELIAVRDGLDLASARAREAGERIDILGKIETFFGLAA